MFTIVLEQVSSSLFSGWDWVDCASMTAAMEKFAAYVADAKLNRWAHIRVENEQGDTIAEWYMGE